MNNEIVKIVFGEYSGDCDYCGLNFASFVEVISESPRIASKFFGELSCFNSCDYFLEDGIKYILAQLGIEMEYSEVSKRALEKVGDRDPCELNEKGELSSYFMRRALNPIFKVPYYESLEDLVIDKLAEQGITLIIVEELSCFDDEEQLPDDDDDDCFEFDD